jgi:signal transduction histidine kinase
MGELVTLNAMTRLLQQHRELVQQGRAALLDAVTDGVVIVVPEVAGQSNQEGFVRGINKTFSDMFHIQPQEAEGLTLFQLLARMHLSEDKTTMLLQEWSKIIVRSPSTQRGEFEIPAPDGDTINLEWYSAPVYQDTRVQGRIYIFHDASAEHTAERLRANFIQRLSHELRTPLSSIQGYAQLLIDQGAMENHERGHVQTIFDNALHLNQLFTDVILMARADNHELRLQKEFTLISDLIHTTARMLEDKATARGLTVEFLLDDKLPYVYIDSHYITQVLEEVLRNAVLYAPQNSVIRVQASHVNDENQLPHGAPGDFHLLPGILLTVADEGFGFSVSESEEVFVPFHRGKNATSAKIPGTGLGLTIARSLIELHRGKIWAEARKRGKFATRFHFILPAVESVENNETV